MVPVSESQVVLQAGLNACHAWSIRSRFTFGIGPTKSAVMIFGQAWRRKIVMSISVAFLSLL